MRENGYEQETRHGHGEGEVRITVPRGPANGAVPRCGRSSNRARYFALKANSSPTIA